jgi:hypothetical protein
MSVPFVSYHAFIKYYAAEPKNSSILLKSCFERLWKIVPKLRPSSKTVCPNSVKQIQGVTMSMQSKGLAVNVKDPLGQKV